MDSGKSLQGVRPGILLLQIPGLLLYGWFLKTGHMAGPSFRLLSLLEFLGAVGWTALFPQRRYLSYAFATIALPRAFSIAMGHDSHNVLFPLFGGMAVGLYFRFLWQSFFARVESGAISDPPVRGGRSGDGQDRIVPGLTLFYLFILLLMVRAFLDSYSPGILTGAPFQDRQVSPGVSSNYAVYLSLLFGLNLLGPLQFIITDLCLRKRLDSSMGREPVVGFAPGSTPGSTREEAIHTDPIGSTTADGNLLGRGIVLDRSIVGDLLAGFGIALVLSLIAVALQWIGWVRLFAGSALSRESGRLPGLFTDSGASSVLFPAVLYIAYLWLIQLSAGDGRALPFARQLARTVMRSSLRSATGAPRALRRAAGTLFLAVLLLLSIVQGRAYFLVLFGLIVYVVFVRILEGRTGRQERKGFAGQPLPGMTLRHTAIRMAMVLLIVLPLSVGVIVVVSHSAAGERLVQTVPDTISLAIHKGLFEAYLHLDRPRALLFQAGIDIYRSHPWIGSGANSFMVQTASLREAIPDLPADNPSTLFLGLLGDTGTIGSLVFLLLFAIYLMGFLRLLKDGGFRAALTREREWSNRALFYGAPLLLIPGFLVGYHFIFAEFAPFLLYPFLFFPEWSESDQGTYRRTEERDRDQIGLKTDRMGFGTVLRVMPYGMAALAVLYAVLYVIQLYTQA